MNKKIILLFSFLCLICLLTFLFYKKNFTRKPSSDYTYLLNNPSFEQQNKHALSDFFKRNEVIAGWKTDKSVKTSINQDKSFIEKGSSSLKVVGPKDGGISQELDIPPTNLFKLSIRVFSRQGGSKIVIRNKQGAWVAQATTTKNNAWETITLTIPVSKNESIKRKSFIPSLFQVFAMDENGLILEIKGADKSNEFYVDDVTLSLTGGSNISCIPGNPDPDQCEFFEYCDRNTQSCQFNYNWQNSLTNEQRNYIYQSFAQKGMALSFVRPGGGGEDTIFTKTDGSTVSLSEAVGRMWRERTIYATFPELSDGERRQIADDLDAYYARRNSEQTAESLNAIMFVLDMYTGFSGAAFESAAGYLVSNGGRIAAPVARAKIYPLLNRAKTSVGNFRIKINNPDGLIKLASENKSSSVVATIAERDGQRIYNTQKILSIESSVTGLYGTGRAARLADLTGRFSRYIEDNWAILKSLGATVDENINIMVAATIQDYNTLLQINGGHGVAVWLSTMRTILIRPDIIVSESEMSFKKILLHEMIHQVSMDKGALARVKNDWRVLEGFTEYIAGKLANNQIFPVYQEQVRGVAQFMYYDFAEKSLIKQGIAKPTRDQIIEYKRAVLDPMMYDWFLNGSSRLTDHYKWATSNRWNFGGKDFVSELIRWLNSTGVPQVKKNNPDVMHALNNTFKNLNFFNPQIVLADIPCCDDTWPADPPLLRIGLQKSLALGTDWTDITYDLAIKFSAIADDGQVSLSEMRRVVDENIQVTSQNVEPIQFITFIDEPEGPVPSEDNGLRIIQPLGTKE